MDKANSGVFENCNNHIREKLVELLDAGGFYVKRNILGVVNEEAIGDLADHLIANGVTVQEWIPLSEKLPEDGVQVLACTKHGKAFSAHCERGKFRVSGSVTVTHWMPLPQPPKGE